MVTVDRAGETDSAARDINNCTSGSCESWMVLSIAGDKPKPRFNVKFLFHFNHSGFDLFGI